VLADWYPIVAGWDETGWRLEPPTDQGDPTFSVTSLYDVRLSVPEGYEVIATGEESRQADGAIRIETGPVREFAMVVAQGLQVISGQSGDTTVSVQVDPAHRANGQHMLEVAISALDFYNDAFGPYPFRELDIVETNLSLAYGVSWSGVLFINETQLDLASGNLATLDFTLFHEIGHQWWGAAIGANSNDHTFMVEGLTNATAVLAQAAVQGPDAATTSLYGWMVTPYLNLLAGSGDAVADMSIFDQPATAPLSTLAYGKGGLGFLAIRNQIGNEAFMAALAAYADAFRLGIAEPDDLLAAFESASGQSLQELWSFWFDSATTTPADIEALVPQIIASL
jgi:aminopeptidase N